MFDLKCNFIGFVQFFGSELWKSVTEIREKIILWFCDTNVILTLCKSKPYLDFGTRFKQEQGCLHCIVWLTGALKEPTMFKFKNKHYLHRILRIAALAMVCYDYERVKIKLIPSLEMLVYFFFKKMLVYWPWRHEIRSQLLLCSRKGQQNLKIFCTYVEIQRSVRITLQYFQCNHFPLKFIFQDNSFEQVSAKKFHRGLSASPRVLKNFQVSFISILWPQKMPGLISQILEIVGSISYQEYILHTKIVSFFPKKLLTKTWWKTISITTISLFSAQRCLYNLHYVRYAFHL